MKPLPHMLIFFQVCKSIAVRAWSDALSVLNRDFILFNYIFIIILNSSFGETQDAIEKLLI